MGWLRFLSRFAFICNCCFLIATAIKWIPNPPTGELMSAIVVLGYLVSVWLNALLGLCCAVLLFLKKPMKQHIPLWLIIVNLLFLIPELILLSA
jgi:hypothetical protein